VQHQILAKFRIALQIYGEHLPFSKLFRKKSVKKCFFVDFTHKNSDYLEYTAICTIYPGKTTTLPKITQ